MLHRLNALTVVSAAFFLTAVGCDDGGASGTGGSGATTSSSTSSSSAGGGGSGGTTGGTGGEVTTSSTTTSTGTGTTMPTLHPVTFTYKPQWAGVTKVDVVGGFGKPGDWKSATPLVSLTDDGTGTWSATVDLYDGDYLYLFRVTGDADAPADFKRYSLDASTSVTSACPPESPTFSDTSTNPCARVIVPQPAPAAQFHITGKVLFEGAPAAGFLVQVDSDETDFGPYFVNRTNSLDDGTFDLVVPTGLFRVQIQHPTYLTVTDVDRDPYTLKSFRRAVSTGFYVGAAVNLLDFDMSYPAYDVMLPTMTSMLPTTFEYTILPGFDTARCVVYGTELGLGTNVGTQWYQSDNNMNTSVVFDGVFNTSSALETNVIPGEQYHWGTMQYKSAGVGKTWRGQSMVLPMTWQ